MTLSLEDALKYLRLRLVKVKETGKGVVIIHAPQIPDGEYILEPERKPQERAQQFSEIVKPEQISTNSATYMEIASWTVTSKKTGKLFNVSMVSDTPAIAQFRLTIAGVQIFADKKFQNILDLDFKERSLSEGQIVKLEGKSDGSTTILFDGCIQGREFH